MPRSIYDKSTRELFKEMLNQWSLEPGQVFTTGRALEWFEQHYPKIRPGTVRAHLVVFSTNDKSRLHHPVRPESDLLFKVDSGQFRLYEPGKDPTPIREMVEGDVAKQLAMSGEEAEAEEDVGIEPAAGSSEFLLERDLQRYLAENLEVIEPGLKLYVDDDLRGIEFEAGGGRRIDILAVDRNGALVVLELKVSRGYDRVVGQLLRYMNWVRLQLAEPEQKVRGIIVCRTMSEDLRLACASIQDVELYEYQLSVTTTRIPALGPRG